MHREGRDLIQVKAMVLSLARLIEAARAAKVRCIWIRHVYNTAPNWYLSEVWLEHRTTAAAGRLHQYSALRGGRLERRFYEIRPLPEEPIVTKHRYGTFERSDLDLVLRSPGTAPWS